MSHAKRYIRRLETLGSDDVALVGGKSASLGEMLRRLKDRGLRVPDGFALTAEAYWEFLRANGLAPGLRACLEDLERGTLTLAQVERRIHRLFQRARFAARIAAAVRRAYRELGERYGVDDVDVAVRAAPPPRTCRRRVSPASRRPS
jgi:pyruvate,water dikinase